jgi:hypothetical protein
VFWANAKEMLNKVTDAIPARRTVSSKRIGVISDERDRKTFGDYT